MMCATASVMRAVCARACVCACAGTANESTDRSHHLTSVVAGRPGHLATCVAAVAAGAPPPPPLPLASRVPLGRRDTNQTNSFTQGESVALRFYAYFLERSDWEPGALGMPDQREQQASRVESSSRRVIRLKRIKRTS